MAIAVALLGKEDGDFLRPIGGIEKDWYRHICNLLLGNSREDFPVKDVAFLTYNYERSLEYYLTTAMKSSYNLGDERSAEKLRRKVPLVHLHGNLGPLPWQVGDSDHVPYGTHKGLLSLEEVRLAAESINIIYDDEIEKSAALKEAHSILRTAGKLVFLGFGYDPVNLERLKLSENIQSAIQIEGTAHRKTAKEIRGIRALLFASVGKGKCSSVNLRDYDNLTLLREINCFC